MAMKMNMREIIVKMMMSSWFNLYPVQRMECSSGFNYLLKVEIWQICCTGRTRQFVNLENVRMSSILQNNNKSRIEDKKSNCLLPGWSRSWMTPGSKERWASLSLFFSTLRIFMLRYFSFLFLSQHKHSWYRFVSVFNYDHILFQLCGKKGMFPVDYVEVLIPLP